MKKNTKQSKSSHEAQMALPNIDLGATPLHRAVIEGNSEAFYKLLEQSSPAIDPVNFHKETPLHYAAMLNLNFTQALIEKGANIHAQDIDGNTPLHNAVLTEQLAITNFLISFGADVNCTTSTQLTPLHIAIEVSADDIITLLMNNQEVRDAYANYSKAIIFKPTKPILLTYPSAQKPIPNTTTSEKDEIGSEKIQLSPFSQRSYGGTSSTKKSIKK